jgi:DNA-directed RNA polymerase specialized sigma24 family protein
MSRLLEAVALRFYAEMSVAEAAAAMACREGTVKALTSQAMATLSCNSCVRPGGPQ